MRRNFYSAVAAASALTLLTGGLAHADTVENDVVVDGTDTIAPGGSTTVGYKIVNVNVKDGDTVNKCNADSTTPAYVTLTLPSGVSASGTTLSADKKLKFTGCDIFQYVSFSSSAAGTYAIASTITDAGAGSYTNNAGWSLKVNSTTVNQATLTVGVPASAAYGSSHTLTSSGGSGDGTVTYEARGTACSVSASLLSITAGTGDCGVRAIKAASTGYNAATSEWAAVGVTTKQITGSFTAADKVYDGNTSATATDHAVSGKVGSDDVTLTGGTATFANENVGTAKTVTLTGASLSGTAAGNYSLSSVATDTADVTPKGLTGSFTAADKVYDGNTSATATDHAVSGKVGSDDVTLTGGTATFANENVGTAKTVTLTGASLSGTAAGNYSLSSVATDTADITPKGLTGSFTAADKVYDGNRSAAITGGSLTGLLGEDAVTLDRTNASASFDSASVGSGKTVTGTGFALSGDDAGNYSLNMGTTRANITYAFGGWQQPVVSLPTRNTVKAGRAVPIRFSLGHDHGLSIFANSTATAAGGPKVTTITCTTATTDAVEDTLTAGSSSLTYDSTSGQYSYVWKTDSAWAGKCLRLALNLKDGSTHTIEFGATK